MKHLLTIGSLCLISILLQTTFCYAQDSLAKKKELILGFGPAAYKGDLSTSYDKWTSVFHIGIKFNRFKKVNGNFNLSIGTVTGENISYSFDNGRSPSPTPNRFFRSELVGLNYELHYNIINKDKFKLFISQGVGMLRYNPQDQFYDNLLDQPSTRALGETYGNVTIFFPTQLGFLYYLPNHFSIGMQGGFWGTTTDYLDNISQWSNQGGKDNILSLRFEVHVPVQF